MRTLILAAVFITMPVSANQWDVIAYECEQLTANKEPAKCSVTSDTADPRLTVSVLALPTDPLEKKKRASYLVESAIYRFTSLGGKWITEQTRMKDGRKVERSCSPAKGQRDRVSCHDWTLRDWQ